MNRYVRCLDILQLVKQAIEQESFERLKHDFSLLRINAEDNDLLSLLNNFETKMEVYQQDISSGISKNSLRSEYGKVFRKIIELIQLSDLSKLNI